MKLSEKVVVVTGGAKGIGRALCRRFAAEGARGVVVADVDFAAADEVAREFCGLAVRTDVSRQSDIIALVERVREVYGPIDLFCSNAGVATAGGVEALDAEWQRSWEVNVMAHVWAARAVLPAMIERGSGYLLHTISSAGLLTTLGAAPYAVTKHAALALAEWLSITHAHQGIQVSALCPLGVNTAMLEEARHSGIAEPILASGPVLEPEQVAEAVLRGIEEGRFLILPHVEVATYMQKRIADHERWLAGMRKQQALLRAPKG